MEVPRLGVESELLPMAFTTIAASPDLSRVCDLHHSSWQHQILNPLGEARGQTHNLLDASRVCLALNLGSSCHSPVEMNLTRIHEDVSSIPGPTQWVKDLVLP